MREILETVTYNKSNYVDQSVERVQSNEPIVAQDEWMQSVGAKRGKVAGGTHFNDLKVVFHVQENVGN